MAFNSDRGAAGQAANAPTGSRGGKAAALAVTIILGLVSRKVSHALPPLLSKYPGDALWALAVFFALSLALPRVKPAGLAGLTMVLSILVELSKFIHTPALDTFRSTTLGHLFLGSVFSWQNLGAYAVGAACGGAIVHFASQKG